MNTDKARPRKTLSCLPCRKRKVKCDYKFPCSQCQLRGKSDDCQYDGHNRWGYSNSNGDTGAVLRSQSNGGTVEASKQSLEVLVKNLAQLMGKFNIYENLVAVYKDLCHSVFPILDLDKVASSVKELTTATPVLSITDAVNLAIVFFFSIRNSSKFFDASTAASLQVIIENLISLLDPLSIQTIGQLESFLMYAIYIYYSSDIKKALPLLCLLYGSMRWNPEIQQDRLCEIFMLVENMVAMNFGLPCFTKSNNLSIDELFLKCRHTLLKFHDRIFSEIHNKYKEETLISLCNEIKSGAGTFGVIHIHLSGESTLKRYKLLAIQSLCNQISLTIFRPFLISGTSENLGAQTIFEKKVLGLSVTLIEGVIDHDVSLGHNMILFAAKDIFYGGFLGSLLLLHDRNQHDQAADYLPYAIRLPPFETPLSNTIWRTGSENWRQDLVARYCSLIEKYDVLPKAHLILRSYLSGQPLVGLEPFTKERVINLIRTRNSLEFEQLCWRTVNQ